MVKTMEACIPAPEFILFTNEDDYHYKMRQITAKSYPEFKKTEGGRAIPFEKDCGNYLYIVQIVGCDVYRDIDIIGLLAHEATHVAQFYFDTIGEDKPGAEHQAYLIQFITAGLVKAYFGGYDFVIPRHTETLV